MRCSRCGCSLTIVLDWNGRERYRYCPICITLPPIPAQFDGLDDAGKLES